MYGIVCISGHQYKVVPGQILDVDKVKNTDAGETMTFSEVIMVNGQETIVGTPHIKGAKVVAKVIRHDRSRKILVLKRRPGKYVKKNGYRPSFTSLLISEIHDGKGGIFKAEQKEKKEKKAAAPKEAAKKTKAKKEAK